MVSNQKPKVHFVTVGCKVNQHDTSLVARRFCEAGFELAASAEEADVIVVNTCTVTATADRKSRKAIRRAARQRPEAVVVAMGCYCQADPEDARTIEGVDVLLGTKDRERVVQAVNHLLAARQKHEEGQEPPLDLIRPFDAHSRFEGGPIYETEGRVRVNLKVQEGCNGGCTYCRVPAARGPSRSCPPSEVLAQAEELVAQGFSEIVLTGIHLGAYGADLQPSVALPDLAGMLCTVPGLRRIRLSSIEPQEVTSELVDLIGEQPTLCRHLHLPLQSGSNRILRAMGRRYTAEEYLRMVCSMQERVVGLAVTADVMVGFPGEEEEDFQATCRLVQQASLAGLHVFRYSPRPGTLASRLPGQVAGDVKRDRSDTLLHIDKDLRRAFNRRMVGRQVEVLVEQVTDDGHHNTASGLTDNYVRVWATTTQPVDLGDLVLVEVAEAKAEHVRGRIVSAHAEINRGGR